MDIINRANKFLKENRDEKYKIFASSLLLDENNLLGVKIPILRKFAKEIKRDDYRTFLNSKSEFMEQTLLKGFVIGLLDTKEQFVSIKKFIPEITNWSICDSFCSSLKGAKKEQDLYFEFIKKYANTKKEFETRFFLVMALNYFVNENYLNEIFEIINSIEYKGYYSKMGAAWLISVIFVKFQKETYEFLKNTKIEKEIIRMATRKIKESKRIKKETHSVLKDLL